MTLKQFKALKPGDTFRYWTNPLHWKVVRTTNQSVYASTCDGVGISFKQHEIDDMHLCVENEPPKA